MSTKPTKEKTQLRKATEAAVNNIAHNDLKGKFANLYDTFGSNPELETKGIILDYALENGRRVEFTIKRAGSRNAAWRKCYNEHMRDENNELKDLNEEESAKVLATVYSETVILGWSGVEDKDGKEIPFTIENCRALLLFLPDLLQMIMNDAHSRANFREQGTEHARKN